MDKKNLKNIESHLISLMKDGVGISAETVQNFRSDFRDLNLMHLENLGDLLHIGVFICDTDGKIIYVNSMNEKLVGVKREECIGEFFKDVLQRHNITNVAIDYVREKKQSYSSLVFVPATGVQILSTGAPIFDIHDTLIGVIVIDQDVSEIMSLTQQLKDSESKTVYYREMNDQTGRVIEQLNRQGINLKKHFTDMEQFVSPAIQKAYELAYQAAQTDVTTLLTGETGTGKEVLANYIFENSARNRGAFVKVNCASIPANLLESELFGYVKGAFTGASDKGKMGLFEVANHGTIFLDEIGELPMDFQAKLLRAIQQKEINRIGSTKIIKLDIRIIAATNRNLKEMAEAGKFRRDLYYRLNVFPIPIPALRERREDIPLLTEHFLAIFNKKYEKNICFCPDAVDGLCRYSWPGNIRELENLIERWAVIYPPFTSVRWDMISDYFPDINLLEETGGRPEENENEKCGSVDEKKTEQTASADTKGFEGHSLKELLSDYEREILAWALQKYSTTRAAADALHIDHSTVVRKAKALGIPVSRKEKD